MNFDSIFKDIKDNNFNEEYDIFIPEYFEVADKTNVDDDGKPKVFYCVNDCYAIGMDELDEEALLDWLIENGQCNSFVECRVNNVFRDHHIKTGTRLQYNIYCSKKNNLIEVIVNNKYVFYFEYYNKDLGKNFDGIKKLENAKSKGCLAYKKINEMGRIKGLWRTTLNDYLVDSEYKIYKHMLKMCVPNQIGWITNKVETIIPYCFKADVSSAFPSQLTKRIPILRKCKVFPNETIPTKDYPFVFTYKKGMKYGRVQILEEDGTYIDTDLDLNNRYMSAVKMQLRTSNTRIQYLSGEYVEDNRHYTITLPDWETTVLCCPASSMTLKEIMEDLYEMKLNGETPEEIQEVKDVMNSFIGYLQMNTNPILPFISAVVIARQNHSMIDRCKQLEDEGNQILYIATDSIVWKGDSSEVATNEKYLGSFTNEYENCKFYGIQVGAYQIECEDKTVKTWATYLKNGALKTNIPFGELQQPKEHKGDLTNE